MFWSIPVEPKIADFEGGRDRREVLRRWMAGWGTPPISGASNATVQELTPSEGPLESKRDLKSAISMGFADRKVPDYRLLFDTFPNKTTFRNRTKTKPKFEVDLSP